MGAFYTKHGPVVDEGGGRYSRTAAIHVRRWHPDWWTLVWRVYRRDGGLLRHLLWGLGLPPLARRRR